MQGRDVRIMKEESGELELGEENGDEPYHSLRSRQICEQAEEKRLNYEEENKGAEISASLVPAYPTPLSCSCTSMPT